MGWISKRSLHFDKVLIMKSCFFAGSFDPITNGHINLIDRALCIFDRVVIAVGNNADKKGYFSELEKIALIHETLNESNLTTCNERIEVVSYQSQFLFQAAFDHKCEYILRGIRDAKDFEYEAKLASFNSENNPLIETVFLMPSQDIANVSSSFVKSLIGYEDWQLVVGKYVSRSVLEKIEEKYNATRNS